MKRAMKFGVLGLLFLVGIAWAAPLPIVDPIARWVRGGLWVGTSGAAGNKVTRILGSGATVIDVATATAACNDSAGTTVTGALVGDTCMVGAPSTITGAGTGLSASFTCYVSAADTVKLRHCPVGVAADDPASGTWYFTVISNQ